MATTTDDTISRAEIAADLNLQLKYVTDRVVKRADFQRMVPEAVRLSRKTVLYPRRKYEAWKERCARAKAR